MFKRFLEISKNQNNIKKLKEKVDGVLIFDIKYSFTIVKLWFQTLDYTYRMYIIVYIGESNQQNLLLTLLADI